MELEEALKATVTKAEAEREVKKHGCDFNQFLKDNGDRENYKGKTVLFWLGY